MVWGFESPSSHQTIRLKPRFAVMAAATYPVSACLVQAPGPIRVGCGDRALKQPPPPVLQRQRSGVKNFSSPLTSHQNITLTGLNDLQLSHVGTSPSAYDLPTDQRHFCAIYRSNSILLNRRGTTNSYSNLAASGLLRQCAFHAVSGTASAANKTSPGGDATCADFPRTRSPQRRLKGKSCQHHPPRGTKAAQLPASPIPSSHASMSAL